MSSSVDDAITLDFSKKNQALCNWRLHVIHLEIITSNCNYTTLELAVIEKSAWIWFIKLEVLKESEITFTTAKEVNIHCLTYSIFGPVTFILNSIIGVVKGLSAR